MDKNFNISRYLYNYVAYVKETDVCLDVGDKVLTEIEMGC